MEREVQRMLCDRIDALLRERAQVIVAIDGCCASGKTTLAKRLGEAYGARVLHMDDFFLRPEQRTPERYAEPGGNVDYERFAEEVLAPLRAGRAYCYRRYDCGTQRLLEGEWIEPGRLTIIEGSYSLHPALEGSYDLKVLLHIDAQRQSERILARNGEAMHVRFMETWIPMEELYFEKTDIERRCDIRIEA